ncbi:MAG: DNA polymerase III subunit gamma/tau [Chloroflexota bacterium]|nr:DNA polymerase III subunit gamma/tau [Chloroflexota bacterium]
MSSTPTQTSTAPHQALYRRWRAQTFAQIVGQEPVVETLRNAVRSDRVSHAILFVGPRGTGKTSLARILAKAVNCTNLQDGDPCDACPSCVAIREGRALDLVEIDAASNRGIDAIRELRERINYAPTDLRRKVYILDEAHQITKDAWNALLKSLEEPPDFVVFMFASTHPQEFPPAILSRLQRYDVRRLTVAEIEGKLVRILEADGRTADPGALHLIARLAAGGMRDAESMLDQLLASSGERLDEARVRDLLGLADTESVERFVEALVSGDPIAGIQVLDGLEDRGRDARVFLDQVVDSIRAALIAALSVAGADRGSAARLAAAARRVASIDTNRAGTGGLRLQLELALFADGAAPSSSAAVGGPEIATESPKPRTAPPTEGAPEAADGPARAGRRTSAERSQSANGERPRATTPRAPSETKPNVAAPVDAAPGASGPDPSSAAVGGDLATLLDRWSELVASVRPATRAVITECRPLSIEGNIVTLGFPEAKAFLKEHAERKRPDLEAAVGQFLGRPVTVRCVATNLDLVPPVPADPDAATLLAEARRIFAEDLVDVGEVS